MEQPAGCNDGSNCVCVSYRKVCVIIVVLYVDDGFAVTRKILTLNNF